MSLAPVEGQPLWEYPDAREFHEEALRAKGAGEFDRAHQLLGEALYSLEDEPETGDRLIQEARLTRDAGFTFTQEAAVGRALVATYSANEMLEEALGLTQRVIDSLGANVASPDYVDFKVSRYAGRSVVAEIVRRKAFGEHGATQTLLGRTTTVNEILSGTDPRGHGSKAKFERNFYQRHYGEAHRSLLVGDNGYYRVVNAVSAMRQVRVNGALQSPYLGPWMARTSAALGYTMQHDRGNLKAATRHLGHLPEVFVPRPQVVEAVLNRP